ncbi:MAG: cytochrome c oxidase assembly protein [Alphaproteobacteria bacterium]
MNDQQQDDLSKKNARMGIIVLGVVCFMIGLSFASVPLYNIFCRVTGWGGTTQVSTALPSEDEILDRDMTVRFDANVASDLDWYFKPESNSVTLKVGARGFINFIAENQDNVPVAGTAVFNVTPLKAGKYFQKVQCFCFNEQILRPNERVNMPVLFYVDPAIKDDRNLDDVKVITLSYSFFKTESEALEKAMDAFFNAQE